MNEIPNAINRKLTEFFVLDFLVFGNGLIFTNEKCR